MSVCPVYSVIILHAVFLSSIAHAWLCLTFAVHTFDYSFFFYADGVLSRSIQYHDYYNNSNSNNNNSYSCMCTHGYILVVTVWRPARQVNHWCVQALPSWDTKICWPPFSGTPWEQYHSGYLSECRDWWYGLAELHKGLQRRSTNTRFNSCIARYSRTLVLTSRVTRNVIITYVTAIYMQNIACPLGSAHCWQWTCSYM